jgi:hypothetical protein
MPSEVMDCFTAFAMTGLFMESPSTGSGQAVARQSMMSRAWIATALRGSR